MLDVSILTHELRAFMDQTYESYVSFPKSEKEAAEAWGNAFHKYITQVGVTSPPTVSKAPPSIDASSSGKTFGSNISFNHKTGTAVFVANMLSTAWASSISSIKLIPGAIYITATPVTVISMITPLSAHLGLIPTVMSKLIVHLSDINAPSSQKVEDIASVLHEATISSLTTTCTYTNPAGTPPTLVGPLVFG
jgi:hypothetical protein